MPGVYLGVGGHGKGQPWDPRTGGQSSGRGGKAPGIMPKAGQPDIPGVTSEAGNPKPSFPILAVGGLVLLGGLAFFLLRKKRKR